MEDVSSPSRVSTYLNALTGEIEKKLRQALASASSQRCNPLQQLFADIALKIDERAKDIIFNREEDSIFIAEEEEEEEEDGKDRLCFYNVLADYYLKAPECGKQILDLIVQLWSQEFASHIFSLLFHKWLFEGHMDNTEVIIRYSSALVQGATNVFWFDIQTNTMHFKTLFLYFLEEVALKPMRLKTIPLQAQQDMFRLLSRFLLFYNSADELASFINGFPINRAADLFVIELSNHLQKLKVEPVMLLYLARMKALEGMELRMSTSTRLKACLCSLTSPGGPVYPTRAVRHAAWDVLDQLYPVGRYPRHLISMCFRLLYPWYWPSSCWSFASSFTRVLFWSFFKIFSSRND